MRRLIVCLTIAGATAAPATSVAASGKHHGGTMCVLHARMTAKDETTGSTSRARGHALIKVRKNGTITFKTKINNPNHETFVAGHIHKAPPATAGPIVVPLFVAPAAPTSARHIRQRGAATPNAGTTGADLCQDPGAYYVNYHTTAFPGGAIRGQLH
jgi:hypothetical protein